MLIFRGSHHEIPYAVPWHGYFSLPDVCYKHKFLVVFGCCGRIPSPPCCHVADSFIMLFYEHDILVVVAVSTHIPSTPFQKKLISLSVLCLGSLFLHANGVHGEIVPLLVEGRSVSSLCCSYVNVSFLVFLLIG